MSNFSPRAQQVIALSRKEAERFNHNFVGTEHLLLGIIALGQGVAWETMIAMGLHLDVVRDEIEKCVGTGPDQKMIGHIPYTPRVKKVLALAAKEARALNHDYVGTEHILLGLLREGDGVAARVLKNLEINVEETRAEILKRREATGAGSEQSDSVPTETSTATPAPQSSNFTPRAQHALTMAEEEAETFNISFVGTEHVLLGLIRLGQGVAVTILAKIGLDEKTVRAQVETLAGRRSAEPNPIPADYVDQVQEALIFAEEEAKKLHHTFIGTEHILLGLLRQTDGGAARIFKNLNIDTQGVREEIFKGIDPNIRPLKKPAMQPSAASSKQPREPVDTTKRYDVYCVARNEQAPVVYRNVLIKSVKTLFQRHEHDTLADFIELEHADGQSVFVAKSTVFRLCYPGVNPNFETL